MGKATEILNEQDYYRIVYGGWLGKNIGGTLGAPVEGVKELLQLDFYPELPDGPLENDDLDLQLVWLHALEQYGPGITAQQLGQEWVDHIFFPFDEYGYALTNLRRGLKPPLAGLFNNPFNNCMGSPIRSEIWAMVAPGMPEVAARYAYEDAITDHAGGEGVYGEMFFAALESAVFYEQDRDTLIEIGLGFIPADCRTALAVRDLLRWHSEGQDWLSARELILQHHGHSNFTDAPQNIAFTLLGWLYGEDFEDAILKAVNCGYDTDCTAATLAAILGMILGPEGLPAKWVDPVGNRVVVSPPINGFPHPATLEELTERTIAMGKRVLAHAGSRIVVLPDLPTRLTAPDVADGSFKELWTRDPGVDIRYLPEGSQEHALLKLEIRYEGNDPGIGAGGSKALAFRLTNLTNMLLSFRTGLVLPEGWQEAEQGWMTGRSQEVGQGWVTERTQESGEGERTGRSEKAGQGWGTERSQEAAQDRVVEQEAGGNRTEQAQGAGRSLAVGQVPVMEQGTEGKQAGQAQVTLSLAAGESYSWDTLITAAEELEESAYPLQLQLTRLHNGAEWAVLRVPFTLVRANGWLVSGPGGKAEKPVWISGNRVPLDEAAGLHTAGWYTGRTALHNPLEREVCLAVSAPGAVRLKLNGKMILDSPGAEDALPAYHRGADGQRIELHLSAGVHQLEVEALRGQDPLELHVLTVAPAVTEQPGFCYSLTDLRLDLPEGGRLK
ncbi:ADP-ribosylglycohydrolase family protein [Paenibacillus sp. MMS20-IR301]|uniref:ADP-ribosylglycohydrolase family protein n=1 Tax=Paenibacillus sp. MMS20-IR301 TaxID=2895946 RepID=UPI0028E82134|nr:ADP-ribosylglycohydrolase family protein [Paenibacillus sp. MMS20-IR301]WNS43177.1 ADP-ribosylglycohydrolase family protein [Paenibacillus sp. MMS20-IR301]